VNTLHYGDNLPVLRNREYFSDESVDLIYLDPPFNSNASYNVLFKSPTGERSHAQIEAFEDTWHWDTGEAEQAFDVYETVYGRFPRLQIVTVADLLDGKKPNIPLIDQTTSGFKNAAREGDATEQDDLPF